MALFFFVIAIFEGFRSIQQWGGFYLILASGFLEALAAIVIYRKRSTFFRQSKTLQWLLTGFMWAVNMALFAVVIRYG